MAKRRRRIEPAHNHTPDLTPRCEAKDCGAPWPFYGVKLPSLDRPVWLCHQHWFYARLDEMRAGTRRWQRQQREAWESRFNGWLEQLPVLVQMEIRAAEEGWLATEWLKALKVKIIDTVPALVYLRFFLPARPLGFGARNRIGESAWA